jgi:stage V sporulation protein AF
VRPQSEKLSERLADNIRELDRQFGLETNFDVLKREIEFGRRKAALFFIDGLVEDAVMAGKLRGLSLTAKDKRPINTLHRLLRVCSSCWPKWPSRRFGSPPSTPSGRKS